MFPCVVIVTLLALSTVRGSVDISVALRRGSADEQAATALVYGGHPLRQIPLRLVLGTPPPDFAPGAQVTASVHDLPGAYAALYVAAGDPLALRELDYGAPLPPRLALEACDTHFSLSVNTTSATLGAYFQWPFSDSKWRGAFVLAPGSAAWLQWRTAAITSTRLRLTNDAPPPLHAGSLALTCVAWDAQGRCILNKKAPPLVLEYAAGRTVTQRGLTVVLDFESAAGVLPDAMYADLLRGAAMRTGHVATDKDLRAITWAGQTLATVDDVGNGDSGGALGTTPLFVADASADNSTVVLGRRALLRLFRQLTYDSAENVWIATATLPLPDATRALLTVIMVVLAWLLVRFYVSTLNVRLGTLLGPPATYRPALDKRQLVFVVLSGMVGMMGALFGYLYAGGGEGVDPALGALLGNAALGALILAGVQFGLLLVLLLVVFGTLRVREILMHGASMPDGGGRAPPLVLSPAAASAAPLLDLMVATLHSSSAAFGLAGTLVPVAGVSLVGLFMLALVVCAMLLPILFYNVLVLLVLLLGKRASPFYLPLWLTQAAIVGLGAVGAQWWVLEPMLSAANASYDSATVQTAAAMTLATLGVLVAFVFAADCHAYVQRQRQKTF